MGGGCGSRPLFCFCVFVYRFADGESARNAILVTAPPIIAVIRLQGEPIRSSPNVVATISDFLLA